MNFQDQTFHDGCSQPTATLARPNPKSRWMFASSQSRYSTLSSVSTA